MTRVALCKIASGVPERPVALRPRVAIFDETEHSLAHPTTALLATETLARHETASHRDCQNCIKGLLVCSQRATECPALELPMLNEALLFRLFFPAVIIQQVCRNPSMLGSLSCHSPMSFFIPVCAD